ncbi:hypothetical protein I316_02375 [Kwoniella heveanensis BCC8398]|uniref:Uncharacterized protein n=1 Tax=Kwoniella heveanensis BCC8398 TaxID=1296120 RepID=A0A1B9GXZ4_9TREE|nr:hypothetical protein I316_02375 [Kwoniella heveanensis BCC8398]
MTYRDSFISTTSSDTYPSTMSSLSASALGLTDSPLPPKVRSSNSSAPSSPGSTHSPVRTRPSQQQLRSAPSKPSLYQEATKNAATRVVQQQVSSEALRSIPPKSSQTHLKVITGAPESASRPTSRLDSNAVMPSRPATTTPVKVATSSTIPPGTPPKTAQPGQLARARPLQPQRAQTAQSVTSTPSAAPKAPAFRQAVHRKPPPSPSYTERSFAEEWEDQLVQNAKHLTLGPAVISRKTRELEREREAQRKKDLEWERMGAWEAGQDATRQAEDPYPPSMPRVPVRAATTGVTTVHIGVRPRLHPSRASDSMLRNQPDPHVPNPLFSPAMANSELPEDAARPSYNTQHGAELLEKAKKEYEAWLAKKKEREGGIDNEIGGTRDWTPQGRREIARPGAVEGLAHSDEYERSPHPRIDPVAVQQMQALHMQMAMQEAHSQTAPQPRSGSRASPDEPKNQPKEDHLGSAQSHSQPLPQDPVQPKAQPSAEIDPQMQAQVQQMQQWGYPYPMMYDGRMSMEGYYPEQGYWDPSYWWGMGMMDDPQQQHIPTAAGGGVGDKKVQFAEVGQDKPSDQQQTASTPVTPEEAYPEM